MKIKTAIIVAAAVLAGCGTPKSDKPAEPAAPPEPPRVEKPAPEKKRTPASAANSVDAYKRDLAQRIAHANSSKMYTGRPQALLRSVVVVKYIVDEDGNLVRTEIMRSNRDKMTESTALAALRNSAPFPRPASHLLNKGGHVELAETWLFNNDGRFQLRTIAEPQMNR